MESFVVLLANAPGQQAEGTAGDEGGAGGEGGVRLFSLSGVENEAPSGPMAVWGSAARSGVEGAAPLGRDG
ncbi:hypothetical protein [Streptomyces canus]|uniref:hypothetical protein n=1 Tax=Streptomyces canus TaxID=58343 RepID=UPI0032496DFC